MNGAEVFVARNAELLRRKRSETEREPGEKGFSDFFPAEKEFKVLNQTSVVLFFQGGSLISPFLTPIFSYYAQQLVGHVARSRLPSMPCLQLELTPPSTALYAAFF